MAEGTETPTAAGATSAANGSSGGPLPPAVKIDVTEIATPFRAEVRRAIQERYGGVGPKLVAFLANTVRTVLGCRAGVGWADLEVHDGTYAYAYTPATVGRRADQSTRMPFHSEQDPYAKQYAEWTGKACEADGIRYELRIISENELEEQLYEANADPGVHGILIYYPVFGTRVIVNLAVVGWSGGAAELTHWWYVHIYCTQQPGFFPSFYGGSMDDYLRDTVSYTKDVGA